VAKNDFYDKLSIVVRGMMALMMVGCGCMVMKSQPNHHQHYCAVLCCAMMC
jgi:hypothetical protein